MFYHSRKLEHVIYDKVKAFVEDDDWLIPAYRWLGSYCGFYPQIWLSRSSSYITGKRFRENCILFGFDYIKGFSIDYEQWENVLSTLVDVSEDIEILEKMMRDYFREMNLTDDKEGCINEERIFSTKDYEDWRDNYLFLENDQVVVPRLNLKVAKEIICSDEKQKKSLRKMGFIEDRIKIRNVKRIMF